MEPHASDSRAYGGILGMRNFFTIIKAIENDYGDELAKIQRNQPSDSPPSNTNDMD